MLTQTMITVDVSVLQGIKGIVLYWLNNVMTSLLNMLCEATEHLWLLHFNFQKTLNKSVLEYIHH